MSSIGTLFVLLLVIFIVGVAIIVGIGFLFIGLRSMQNRKEARYSQNFDTTNPSIRAHQMLLETDRLLSEATQDLAFAQAQFGEDSTQEFAKVLEKARAFRNQAFDEEPRLQDEKLITASKIESAGKIISLCEQAQALIKSQQASFDSLRQIEAQAPEDLDKLRSSLLETQNNSGTQEAELASLAGLYGNEKVASLQHNPAQVKDLLAQTQTLVTQIEQALSAGQNAQAVKLIRDANNRLQQAKDLNQAIAQARDDLGQPQQALVKESSELGAILDRVARSQMGAQERAPLEKEARDAIAQGEDARNGKGDALVALARIRQAKRILTQALAPNKEVEELRDKQRQQIKETLPEIEGLVSRAVTGVRLHNDRTDPLAHSCQQALAQAKAVMEDQPAQALTLLTQAKNDATNLIRLNDYHTGNINVSSPQQNPYGVDPTWMILGGVLEELSGMNDRGRRRSISRQARSERRRYRH